MAKDFVDEDGDGLDDRLELRLAETFAPVLTFGPLESNYPVTVEWLLARTTLSYRDRRRRRPLLTCPLTDQRSLIEPLYPDLGADASVERPTSARPEQLGPTAGWYLDDVAPIDRRGSTDPKEWITYVHVYPTAGGGVMVQYWHIFAYNRQCLVRHGGDWDASVHVQLDSDHELLGAWFSRHLDDHPGTFVPAGELELVGRHPIVAIDEGGHAAYASPDDWMRHPGTPIHVPGGVIVWPRDPDDPATLDNNFSPRRPLVIGRRAGGTIWETWTGGEVRQAGNVAHRLVDNPSTHGGMVNVGEYSPGPAQGLSCLTGELRPLHGQHFIAYSGFWGRPRRVWHTPRGPVFQGWHRGLYRSWYNQAMS